MNKIHTLADRIGITLTPMQETVADRLLHTDRNVVVLSPTGSGKTFAYLLPLVAMIDATRQEVQAVVVVPGRELALQSQQVLESMRTGLRSMAVYGGRPTMEEHRKMREVRPQVVFGTPGRLNDHIDKGNLEAETVGVLVIDEYDKCLEMGFPGRDEPSRGESAGSAPQGPALGDKGRGGASLHAQCLEGRPRGGRFPA